MNRTPPAAAWHPVPNRLTDELLPGLKDTELRVLLVVLRATAGWRASPGGSARKRRDWLSHRQLCRRTGRGSEAVSGAVGTLVGRSLLAVEDAAGRPLVTPEERRRHLGRLYYAAGKALANGGAEGPVEKWKTGEPFPSGKTEDDKRTEINKRGGRRGK